MNIRKILETAFVSIIIIITVFVLTISYHIKKSNWRPMSESPSIASPPAELMRYPAKVRVQIVRMRMNGQNIEKLRFNTPNQFITLDTPEIGVFHPNGGGVTYQYAPADQMADGQQRTWHFNMEFSLNMTSKGIGTDENDLIVFLPGITKELCLKTNEALGVYGEKIPPHATTDLSPYYTKDMIDDGIKNYQVPPKEKARKLPEGLEKHYYGCFKNTNGEYVYYHALAER